jgi:hypothetical protein
MRLSEFLFEELDLTKMAVGRSAGGAGWSLPLRKIEVLRLTSRPLPILLYLNMVGKARGKSMHTKEWIILDY